MRVEKIGDATLYLGDCLEVLPTLSGVDAVVTDPPYGIGKWSSTGGNSLSQDECDDLEKWDIVPTEIWPYILRVDQWIVWGGNRFAKFLGSCRSPMIWDKKKRRCHLADAEIAWTSFDWGTVRILDLPVTGTEIIRNRNVRYHPTQKPLQVMSWSVGMLKGTPEVTDPFMGSGTTGVACANLRRKFVGIEIEPKYFDIACERIEQAYQQPRLFEDKDLDPPKQLEL